MEKMYEQAERITKMEKPITVDTILRLKYGGEKVFGPGLAQLLEGIVSYGSLRHSATEMGMSYNKAWNIVKNSEVQFGRQIIERKIGGVHGGGAVLTEFGQELLTQYRAFEQAAQTALGELVQQYFKGM